MDNVNDHVNDVNNVRVEVLARLDKMETEKIHLSAQLDKVNAAFPYGDLEAHRRYHESIIEWRELRNKIVREALVKAVGTGFLSGGVWLLYTIWQAMKMSFKQ